MAERVLGVIGGSGLYGMDALRDVREHVVDTPFGAPSDAVIAGRLGDTQLLFLPRHGRSHHVAPHEINYRANVLALKQLGAEQVVSVSAVGSMREEIRPGDVVLVDQFIDRTRTRPSTFFESGAVAHVEMAEPVDAALMDALHSAANKAANRAASVAPLGRERAEAAKVHRGGVYVCIEGPQFSTRAESLLYRSWGVDVIGMTNLPEARLCREAELPYATMALATDYDCWHQAEASVNVPAVLEVLRRNVATAQRALAELATSLPDPASSPATRALEHALITPVESLSEQTRSRLQTLLARHLERGRAERRT